MTNDPSPSSKKTLLLSGLVLLVAAAVLVVVFSTEPTATRGGAVKQTAMLVEVTPVERGAFRPVFVVTGTVEPAQEVELRARVSGKVVELAPSFTPGGFVEKGDMLLRVDSADYRNALSQEESELGQALLNLELELGQQSIAREEFGLVEGTVSEQAETLSLRKPQLNAALTRVEAARAAVRQAKLEIGRTRIEAPFDAHVLERAANVGSQVSPEQSLGRLVGIAEYWVIAAVPLDRLRWLSVPQAPEGEGSQVQIRNRVAWPEGVTRRGSIKQLIGALDTETRLAPLVISIPDPLARSEQTPDDAPRLIVGEFVEARLEGERIDDVVRLERDYVRKNDTAWVMKDDALEIRQLTITLRDARYAYVAEGLDEGDRVVTTNLSSVTAGAPLRVESAEAAQ